MDSPVDNGVQLSAAVPDASASRGGGLLWYLGEAIAIARLDRDAIRRTAADPRALFYGALVLCATAAVLAVMQRSGSELDQLDGVARGVASTLTFVFAIGLQVCVTALRVALIHGAAKFFFGATGRYRSLLQVIWLGWVVQLFNLIPLIGLLIASAWTLIISIWTFEEVDGIERLQALMLVLGVGVFTVAVLALFSLAG